MDLLNNLPRELLVAVPTLVVSLVIGLVWGRSGRRALVAERDELERELQRNQQSHEQQRTLAKMRREADTVANLAMTLPHVVRDLNRDDVDPSEVPRMILQLAGALFEPAQILLYGIRRADGKRVLTLSAYRGLDKPPPELQNIPVGQGKIGWVADHELDMLPDDWKTLKRNDRLDVPHNHSMLKADIIGPLVHHAQNRQQVLGVLCVGAPRIRPRDPKLMFQMVTNFGSLALMTAWNLKKLRSAAHHDGLTGLLNKRFFLGNVAAQTLIECEKHAQPFAIFIFDIDHFKTFNDTNGHPAGDELLRSLGGMIRKMVRPGDLACRYGGEEFVIAMPNTDKDEALRVADAFRAQVADEPFLHRENQPGGRVSISGGVASYPKDGSDVAELIQHADEALYASKKSGRNRVGAYKGVDIGDSGDLYPVVEDPSALGTPIRR